MGSKWFCFSETGLDNAVKTATYVAGYVLATKNKEVAVLALPVAKGILGNSDSDNLALNAVLQEGIKELLPKVSKDPVIQGAILGVLNSLNFDLDKNVLPSLSNEEIKDLVSSFISGAEAGIGK